VEIYNFFTIINYYTETKVLNSSFNKIDVLKKINKVYKINLNISCANSIFLTDFSCVFY
jgi:hypothetical protein